MGQNVVDGWGIRFLVSVEIATIYVESGGRRGVRSLAPVWIGKSDIIDMSGVRRGVSIEGGVILARRNGLSLSEVMFDRHLGEVGVGGYRGKSEGAIGKIVAFGVRLCTQGHVVLRKHDVVGVIGVADVFLSYL